MNHYVRPSQVTFKYEDVYLYNCFMNVSLINYCLNREISLNFELLGKMAQINITNNTMTVSSKC